jgi:hypothetical protein
MVDLRVQRAYSDGRNKAGSGEIFVAQRKKRGGGILRI